MSTTTPTTKNQHYVPQFYLRKFINSKNEVEVLDCEKRQIIKPRGTKGICSEDYFYGIRTGTPDQLSQHIETQFQKFEDAIAREWDAIIEKILQYQQISDDEKWLIALLVAMIWIRGPKMREQINKMSEQVYRRTNAMKFSHPSIEKWFDQYEKDTGNKLSPDMREKTKKTIIEGKYSLDFNNSQHAMMFEDVKNYANMFWGQNWIVYISKSDKKFTTCDNPVTVIIPKTDFFWGPTFLERTHYFPLTPDIFIEGNFPVKDTGKKIKRKTLFSQDNAKILELNMWNSGQAHEFAYARERQSLEDITNELKDRNDKIKLAFGRLAKT